MNCCTLDTRQLANQCRQTYELANDDTFLYSRCVALINGPDYYEKARSGQNKDIWGIEFEAILYVPIWAWARKHGKEAAKYPHTPRYSCETGSNKKVEEETGVDSIIIKTV